MANFRDEFLKISRIDSYNIVAIIYDLILLVRFGDLVVLLI